MPKIVREFFTCSHCGSEHELEKKADSCFLGHDIVYIGLERQEWRSLMRSVVEAARQDIHFDPAVVDRILKHKIGVSR